MHSRYKHIVIADDDPDDVELFEAALKEVSARTQLSIARDGAELMNFLKRGNRPEVIILDINMPFKGGKECLSEIRKTPEYNDMRIIMLSTSQLRSDIDFCLSNGATDYIAKPPSYSEMIKIVERIFND